MSKIIPYIQYLTLFALAQSVSIWGSFYTLKYTGMGMLESYFRAIPFAWIAWFFITICVGIGNKYKLVTPTQNILTLIILQFIAFIFVNTYWLKQKLTRSDLLAIFIILFGYYVSFSKIFSKMLGL